MTVKKNPVSAAKTEQKKINYSELGVYLHAPVNSAMAKEFTSFGQATYNITWTEGQNADQFSEFK